MPSREIELELKLKNYNNKLLLYTKIIKYTPTDFLKGLWLKKSAKTVEKRNECFRQLRELVRKKHPEMFT
jgi:hypothetical protein